MPRFVSLVAALACAACCGQGLAQSPGQTHNTRAGLSKIQPVRPLGARLDDQMIEDSDQLVSLREIQSEGAVEPTIDALPLAQEPLEASLAATPNIMQINLPSALALVGGQHPAVGLAQWKVREAYTELEQARVLWLPSIRAGLSYHRHDGNLQASDGQILDVNRGSLQYGLGTGAVGAGTTMLPGIVAQFHLADALFQPKIARKRAWSQTHAAGAALNRQLLEVATSYIQLTGAHQEKSVLQLSQTRTSDLAKLTRDFAEAGQGLQSDADRMQTELMLIDSRVVASTERVAVAAARLAQSLSTHPASEIVPLDSTVVPIEMTALGTEKGSLIATGLSNRPELKQARTLVAAACDEYKRQKFAPFVPSVLLGLSTGGFGGGLGNTIDDVDNRYDFDAVVSWNVRHLGFGERAARRASNARIQQAKYDKVRLMNQVAREIAEAHAGVELRSQQVAITRKAIETAENSYQRNLSRIRDAQGLPLEVLQSVRALEDAQLAHLRAIVDYNTAQFRLQWALGWPITAEIASAN